jgi:hypothetical protein
MSPAVPVDAVKKPHRSITLGIILGLALSVPLAYGLIKWESVNRGVAVNHWQVSFGTGNFGHHYLLRAAIAAYSLGNAVPEEALFFHAFEDSLGRPLTGEHRYRITFPKDKLPPVNAFWSLTAYNAKDSFLVHNPLQRYSISNRTPGVKANDDGSLTFMLEKQTPQQGAAQWLPLPEDGFTVTLRTYMPKPELTNLQWQPPGIERMD